MAGEWINDEALDGGIDWIVANGTKLHITNALATTYAEANATYALGNKTITMEAIANSSPDGRRTRTPSITDGSVTASGTASHWAITNGTNTLVATGPLSGTTAVTNGGTFTLAQITITLRDATAA